MISGGQVTEGAKWQATSEQATGEISPCQVEKARTGAQVTLGYSATAEKKTSYQAGNFLSCD